MRFMIGGGRGLFLIFGEEAIPGNHPVPAKNLIIGNLAEEALVLLWRI